MHNARRRKKRNKNTLKTSIYAGSRVFLYAFLTFRKRDILRIVAVFNGFLFSFHGVAVSLLTSGALSGSRGRNGAGGKKKKRKRRGITPSSF